MTSLQSDPGPLPVLAIVACGFAFAVCMFQLLRLGAASPPGSSPRRQYRRT